MAGARQFDTVGDRLSRVYDQLSLLDAALVAVANGHNTSFVNMEMLAQSAQRVTEAVLEEIFVVQTAEKAQAIPAPTEDEREAASAARRTLKLAGGGAR